MPMISETVRGFPDGRIETGFQCYLARKSRWPSICVSHFKAFRTICSVAFLLSSPVTRRSIVIGTFLMANFARQIWAAISLSQSREGRHQSIKALVVLQDQMTQVVCTILLNKGELGFRAPVTASIVQAMAIVFFECPLSVSLNMHMGTMLMSCFLTISAYLESPAALVDGRMWHAGAAMLGCIFLGCIVPLYIMAASEKRARAAFMREYERQLADGR